ncbi:flagellar motor protein [Rheinheimera riviphila]|uniref:Flagellar motor protein n=1 Tax=Rheinheimera riviphila TaxID=1834037 RepID=A0A437R3F5_9GAMM|nr:flagellar motor protein [Rheinheimera riviphila]RVU41308.1 flagellar motor protein [Rheinheimera riviphila]
MDKLAFAGLILGLVSVASGYTLHGGLLSTLFDLPALVIVLGGTLGAVIFQTPLPQFTVGIKMLGWVFKAQYVPLNATVERLINWGTAARTNGFLSLEAEALQETDPFLHNALNLLVDGVEPAILQDALDAELTLERERLLRSAKIYEAMGGYSPTIGIIGAVLGLIQAMQNIDKPELLGHGIATAFVATVYGVGFANLVFIPISNKLKSIVIQRTLYQELIVEGVVSIANGENPRVIERKLAAYRVG